MSDQVFDFAGNEEARLNALRDLRLLDTPPSESFDRLTRLASRLLMAPVSTITLTDKDRLWFKSRFGIDATEVPREKCPCSYTTYGQDVFVVPDLLADPRFCDGVVAEAGVRFYAGAPLISAEGYGLGTICVVDDKPRDITEDERAVLRDLAGMVMCQIDLQSKIGRIDPSSGYPNQQVFYETVEAAGRTGTGGRACALLVDLVATLAATDGQRALGTDFIEALMTGALGAIERGFGDRASIYHVGPTRFAMLLGAEASADVAGAVARVHALLEAPIACRGVPVSPDAAIGTCLYEPGSISPRDLLRRLYNAVEDAQTAPDRVAEYCPLHDDQNARRFRLLNDFQAALDAPDQLALAYQPRVDLSDMHCRGVEALLRWRHPTFGAVAPDEYIPHVERTALCARLTDWVVAEALRQASLWRRAGRKLTMSINASALNLEERDFAERLLGAIERAGVRPEMVELEFTESAVARDSARVIAQLVELRSYGVEIAIDDFGAGYSNLSYLQQLPASVLKIDRQFVMRLETSPRDQKLVQTVIRMAHDLGYRVVAEGIETEPALDMLRGWTCDEGQGFLLSRPTTAVAIEDWLDAGLNLPRAANA